MEGTTTAPSFGQLILGRAWSNTRRFFRSVRRDLLLCIFEAICGFAIFFLLWGLPAAQAGFLAAAAFTFGPIGLTVALVFIWNLAIAPAELAYEAIRLGAQIPVSAVADKPPEPDYSIWRRRQKYSIREFGTLLDNVDPIAAQTTANALAYQRLLIESAKDGTLPYIRRYEVTSSNALTGEVRRAEVGPDEDSKVQKSTAMAWAKNEGLNVSRLE